jgi:hypothetical protein
VALALKWDPEFESTSLQRGVCEPSVPLFGAGRPRRFRRGQQAAVQYAASAATAIMASAASAAGICLGENPDQRACNVR